MNNSVRCLILCVLACVLSASAVVADSLGSLREATTAIEVGDYNRAGPAIEQALAENESDPLVRLALAALYLHAGKLDDSAREFRVILVEQPEQWRAHYGLALIALLKGDKTAVRSEISSARELSSGAPDVIALDLYTAYLAGRTVTEPDAMSPLTRQVVASISARASDRRRAKDLFLELLGMPAQPGFEENRAPVATFSIAAPVSIPHGKLDWSPMKKESIPEVSETVHLNADASRADGVELVSFYVDGSFVGMSNWEPYSFNWNTTRHPNGLHQIRIDGKDLQGNVVSSKSAWVRVKNAGAAAGPRISGPDADEIMKRLWDCIRLSECRRLAHFELARIYLADDEKEAAIRQLEYAIAFRPDFGDAKKLLDKLQGRPLECREIRSGPVGRKNVAITFDDGPNERTANLLNVLAELSVPATFFLVGFRTEAQPQLVKAIDTAGHDIENHSYTHPNLATLRGYEIEEQLCKTNAVVRSITGKAPRFFRPPGGNFGNTVKQAAAKHGMSGVFWTVNCGHYEGGDSAALADFVIENISDGAIVLMHNGEPATVGALPTIAERLRGQGYEFVTITDLVGTE
jgi:peptidoglycan/xylan/chitin deacetylase (PgdA/CDA1 family)